MNDFVAKSRRLALMAALLLGIATLPVAAQQPLNYDSGGAPTTSRDFSPPGTLWDNDVNNFTTSLLSQRSSSGSQAAVVDDFVLDAATCPSGQYEITRIRYEMVRSTAPVGPLSVELFTDDGSGTQPAAFTADPGTEFPASTVTLIGPFGAFQIFAVEVPTPGLTLSAGTWWLSGFDAGDNTGNQNFWATSDGAAGTTANGLIYAPDFAVNTWTDAGGFIAPTPPAFAFAVDGECIEGSLVPGIPTLSPLGMVLMIGALLAASIFLVSRRRRLA